MRAGSDKNLFKAGSPESLAEKIDYWLDHPEQLKEAEKKYAQLGKQYALEHSIRKIEKVYSSMTKKK